MIKSTSFAPFQYFSLPKNRGCVEQCKRKRDYTIFPNFTFVYRSFQDSFFLFLFLLYGWDRSLYDYRTVNLMTVLLVALLLIFYQKKMIFFFSGYQTLKNYNFSIKYAYNKTACSGNGERILWNRLWSYEWTQHLIFNTNFK